MSKAVSEDAAAHALAGYKQVYAPGEFLTDGQLAKLLHVTTRTTLRWRRDGGGPPYLRAGERRVLYHLTDVQEWLAARRFGSLAAEAVA